MTPIISIRDMHNSYSRKHVFRGINLDFYSGQVIGYIGSNGTGKSTTFKILCGLLSDDTGGVMIIKELISRLTKKGKRFLE